MHHMIDGRALAESGELLYTDTIGKDACGIGGVASKAGTQSAEVVRKACTALKALEHRGGVCGHAGDGAGLTAQIPQSFFREEAKRLGLPGAKYLGSEDRVGIGAIFYLDTDLAKIATAREMIA